MTFSRESSCRYRSPLAIPLTILACLAQSRSLHFVASERNEEETEKDCLVMNLVHHLFFVICHCIYLCKGVRIGEIEANMVNAKGERERERTQTEEKRVKTSVSHVLIDKKLFISLNAATYERHKIPVLKLYYQVST